MPNLAYVTVWSLWDVPSGVGETPMTPGTWELMGGGLAETSAAMLDQRGGGEGSGRGDNKMHTR